MSPGDRAAARPRLQRANLQVRGIPRLARREGPLPLSFAQQRQWFFSRLYPHSAAYNVPSVLRLRGVLDAAAMAAALSDLVARHEPLRSVFALVDGEPCQFIRPPAPVELPLRDIAAGDAAAREAALAERVQELVALPFDLGAGPVLRAELLRFGAREHVLVLVIHHIATDGWSLGVLERELSLAYQARRDGAAAALAPLSVQYADFAVWQRAQLTGESLAHQLAYWREALAGAPPRIELPVDGPAPAQPGFRGGEVAVRIGADLASALRAVARGCGATPFMLLLAAFQLLLARHADQDDVVVGAPVAGRSRVETEGLIGMFVNMLALRCRVSGDPAFTDLVAAVRDTALSALDHQQLPFEKLVDEMKPSRELGHNPLFNVTFAYQNMPRPGLRIAGLDVEHVPIACTQVRFDLELSLRENEGSFCGWLRYDRDLFDEATVADMAQRFDVLLRGIAADPGRRARVLPLLADAERRRLQEWATRSRDYPSAATVHGRFCRQVQRAPEATAVEDAERRWSYRELDRRSDAIAASLAAAGVRRGDRVALCLARGAQLVAAMLGVLKAGAAYLPLDPDTPGRRLRAVIGHAGAALALVDGDAARTALADVPQLDVGRCCDGGPAPRVRTGARDVVYVAYTSGSTGTPKGVVVDHRAVLRLVCGSDYLQITSTDRVAQIANPAFDALTFEVWGALLNGARLVIVAREASLSPTAMRRLIEADALTLVFLATALFNALAREAPQTFAGLSQLLFGGEAADPECVRAVLEHGAPGRLLNVYGPTENTTFSTWYRVTEVPAQARTVPIGGPVANTAVYVLDRGLAPVPIGVCGELYLGGDGLAHGYLGAPATTAEAFVPDPLSGQDGARLYRSGDRARWRRDGTLEFVGRRDQQLKLRGFRVEPAEVAATLRRLPGVAGAAVVPQRGDLVAYVVPAHGERVDEGRALASLREELPAYMVPAHIVAVPRLPLTANGKLDRAGLPAPLCDATAAPLPAEDVIAAQVGGVWRDLLGLRDGGVEQDFFAAGGHSLLSVAMLAEVERVTGVSVDLGAFVRSPTLPQLVEQVRRGSGGCAPGLLVPIRRRGSRPPLFFVPGGGGGEAELAYVYGALVAALDRDQPVYGLRAPGSRDHEVLPDSVERIAAAFVSEIRALQPHGPYYLGGECIGGVVAYEIARQLVASGADVGLLVMLESRAPSDEHERRVRGLTGRRAPAVYRRALGAWSRRGLQQLVQLARMPARQWRRHARDVAARAAVALRALRAEAGIKRRRGGYQRTVVSYRAREYPGRITLLVPQDNTDPDPSLGWAALAAGGVEVHRVPGDHRSYVREHAAATAECLQRCLARGQRAGDAG